MNESVRDIIIIGNIWHKDHIIIGNVWYKEIVPYIPNDYNASDTFTFVQEINNLPMFGKCLISFDVESLFTNIPLEECLDLAVKYISEGNPDLKLTPSDLKRIFSFATAETHFCSKVPFMTRLMGLSWAHPWLLSSPISLWATMKRSD